MGGENEDDDAFDATIGALEDIIMDDEFQTMQVLVFLFFVTLEPSVE